MAQPIIARNLDDGNSEYQTSSLWDHWWNALLLLRPAFSYTRTFFWFAVVVAGFTVRTEMLGVSSIVCALRLQSSCYAALLRNFQSNAIRLDALSSCWASVVLRLFPSPLRVNGRLVLVGDGIKIAKHGTHMPAVKLLHQQSENKPTFIMGHSFQVVSLLACAQKSVFAVPLAGRIHEGLVRSNRHWKTLLDKMLTLLGVVNIKEPVYFVADSYYAARTIVFGLNEQQHHLITRVKSNAVGYAPYEHHGPKKRGRPRIYGEKITVASLLSDHRNVQQIASPVYGEKNVTLCYAVRDLLWKPLGRLVRFVAVEHPHRGVCLLMSTDTALDALDVIRTYGLRFKIEHSFKQAVHVIGTFAYHFWMKAMTPLRSGSGDQYLHRKTPEYRESLMRKVHSYHVFLQAGIIAQGLLQYLAVAFPKPVWNAFDSWLRTVRPGIPPSEFVTAWALRRSLPYFLLSSADHHAFAKFVAERQHPDMPDMFAMAA